jgi:hypothetical protein
MKNILEWYLEQQNWINFIKDAVFFVGAYKIISYIRKKNFVEKTKEIERDLKTRESLETKLLDFVLKEHKNKIKDIGVRFVYWKNYPRQLADDGYKKLLAVDYIDDQTLLHGWIDKTGVNFQEHLWFARQSIYAEKNGIFFLAPEGGSYKGFVELSGKRLLFQLPFSNIINFDFKEFIEYEPIFYVRYEYCNFRKLYDRTYICRERYGDNYFLRELDRRYQIRKYSFLRYWLSRAGFAVDLVIKRACC